MRTEACLIESVARQRDLQKRGKGKLCALSDDPRCSLFECTLGSAIKPMNNRSLSIARSVIYYRRQTAAKLARPSAPLLERNVHVVHKTFILIRVNDCPWLSVLRRIITLRGCSFRPFLTRFSSRERGANPRPRATGMLPVSIGFVRFFFLPFFSFFSFFL